MSDVKAVVNEIKKLQERAADLKRGLYLVHVDGRYDDADVEYKVKWLEGHGGVVLEINIDDPYSYVMVAVPSEDIEDALDEHLYDENWDYKPEFQWMDED